MVWFLSLLRLAKASSSTGTSLVYTKKGDLSSPLRLCYNLMNQRFSIHIAVDSISVSIILESIFDITYSASEIVSACPV